MYSLKDIIDRSNEFNDYIGSLQGGEDLIRLLNEWSRLCNVYIFSGLIRNFFVDESIPPHDIDIVVSNIHIEQLKIDQCSRNKFGGVKFKVGGYIVDVWQLDDTWGIIKKRLPSTPSSLLHVVFFNYSSIIFDYNNKKFIVSTPFLNFMNKKQIDLVYSDNPMPSLCILNTLHYSKIFNFSISNNLKKWIKNNHITPDEFTQIQIEHFGEKKYEYRDLLKIINVEKNV